MNGALRKRFLREAITDRSRLSSGAPTQLVAALTGSLGPLSVLAKGDVEVSDRTVRLSGESLYPESAGRAAADLKRALPADWSGTASVAAPGAAPDYDSQTCARLFSERVAGRPLRFAPGSSELTPDFYPVLDALADIAKACRTEHVEVLGHVDPAGTPPPKPAVLPEAKAEKASSSKSKADKAQKSSKAAEKAKPQPQPAKEPEPDLAAARAAAIVDYLLKAGVPPEHALAAQGAAPLSDRQGIGLALRS
jgi:outer membrane protein OmpA-like peptidoglycan-associated protein